MNYDTLLVESDSVGLTVKEKPLLYNDGRIKGNRIAIKKGLATAQKKCVLAEELGHYYTTVGDILDQNNTNNRKQELRARVWSYNKLIGLTGIINAYKHGCQSLYEIADYLEVTEEFLSEALQQYKRKYGEYVVIDNYIIFFVPFLGVFESYTG